MDTKITPAHAEIVRAQVGPGLRYLVKLRQRMDAASMTTDPLYALFDAAEVAVRQLSMALHVREREQATDRRPLEPKPPKRR